jgi:hypothetical protein
VWCAFFVSLLLLPMHVVFAVELTSISTTTTSHVTSASANYKFTLLVDGSGSWAGGETMTITFPSGYALTSFTEDDIDVADDGVDLTTAADCTGSEQVGVGISGAAVTFTMCTGDGGDIASNSVIDIEMGLNASSSGVSAHQVTNPSSQGSYFIAFSGTFGSGGSVVMPINAASGEGVSVTVPPAQSGGGGDSCTVNCGEGGGDDPPVDPPVDPPADPPVDPPVDPPADPPVDPPVDPPADPPVDPPVDPPADPPVDPGGDGDTLDYEVGVSEEEITLPVIENTVEVISYTSPDLQIIIQDGDANAVTIELGGELYSLIEIADNVWTGEVPVGASNILGTISVESGEGTVATSPLTFDVSLGVVYEIIEGATVEVEGVTVTVLNLDGSVWDGSVYGESASLVTNAYGSGFAWYIPNGTYVIRVEKNGYDVSETTITVNRGVLAPTLFISPSEDEILPPDFSTEPGETPGKIPDGITLPSEAVSTFLEILQEVTFEQVATTALLVAVVAVVAAGVGQLWLIFYSFFSQPLLIFARRKHKKIGVVYNSVTKVPIDLVTVRAFDVKTGRLVKTMVTNERGEFFLRISKEGTYRLQAMKQGFVFPSTYLKGAIEDGVYVDVYTGQYIEVSANAEALAVAIPLDPEGSSVPAKTLRWQRTRRRIALVLSPLSVVFSVGIAIVYPGIFSATLLGLQITLYYLTWKVTHRKRKETWGIVYDEASRRPVGNVVIRLFEPKYNKLVESVLSDANGRYVFALGPNEYYVTFAKDGYQDATVKPIDLKTRKEITLFGINIPLRRRNRS